MTSSRSVRILGAGRSGGAFARALRTAGWNVDGPHGRGDHRGAADGVDLLLLCVNDAAVAPVAASVDAGHAVVAHVAGSLTLGVLAPHVRRASVHPLVALPDAVLGAARLADSASFAVAGDAIAAEVVAALGGRAIEVADGARASYHAAACIASNHLVALLGQVERVARSADVPLDAFWGLVRGTVDNVEALGPAAALTGPAARGDRETIERHREALPADELAAYDAMVVLARRLVDSGSAVSTVRGATT